LEKQGSKLWQRARKCRGIFLPIKLNCYLTTQVDLAVICKITVLWFWSLIIVLDNQDCYLDNYLPEKKKEKQKIKLEEV